MAAPVVAPPNVRCIIVYGLHAILGDRVTVEAILAAGIIEDAVVVVAYGIQIDLVVIRMVREVKPGVRLLGNTVLIDFQRGSVVERYAELTIGTDLVAIDFAVLDVEEYD